MYVVRLEVKQHVSALYGHMAWWWPYKAETCCFTSNHRIYIFYIRYDLCFWLPSHLSSSPTQRGWHPLKLIKREFSRQILEKIFKYKFRGNPFGKSRVESRGQTDTTKLKVVSRNIACEPKNSSTVNVQVLWYVTLCVLWKISILSKDYNAFVFKNTQP